MGNVIIEPLGGIGSPSDSVYTFLKYSKYCMYHNIIRLSNTRSSVMNLLAMVVLI